MIANVSLFEVLPPSCFDSFSVGAILAYGQQTAKYRIVMHRKNVIILGLAFSIVLSIVTYVFTQMSFLFTFFLSVFSLLIIAQTIKGIKGVIGWFLNFKLFQYFGKISYGMYIYHNFMNWLFSPIKEYYSFSTIEYYSLLFVFLIFICTISWFIIEKPINDLKKYVAYPV